MFLSIRTRSCEDACNKIAWGVYILGMLPTNERFHLHPRLLLLSILTMIILSANTLYWITNEKIKHEGFYHYIIYSSRKILETLTVVNVTVQFIARRDRFRSIVYNLKSVECALAEVGERWSWSIHPRHYMRFPLLTVFFILLPHLSEIYWLVMHVELFFIGAYVTHVCTFHDMLKYCLNKIRTTEECTSHTKLYSMVEGSFEDLNALNGVGIFLVLVSYFLNLLHQMYQLLNIDDIPIKRYVELLCTVAYYGAFILWVIFMCSAVSSEEKKFNADLYNNVAQKYIEDQKYNDVIFHFVTKKGLRFEAHGFFSVNNSLILSMIITATTYLVILIQWSPRMPSVDP